MADVNKTIEISYQANIGALQRALKKIPGITEEQMKKAVNEIEKELKNAERAADKTSKSFKQKFAKMGQAASMAGVAIAGAGVAMLEFGQRVADATNDLVDTSTKTGIAADTLQGLKIAAEGSGLAFEQFIGPLQRLQFHMVEANKGNKTATKLFKDMGISVDDANGELKNADTLFREMMTVLGDMDSELERNALLMRTFGKSGAMFAQSGVVGAMDEFVSLGREFGVDVGPAAVKQAADFQRAMADLSTVGSGAMQDILMTITGKNGLGTSIDALAEGVIYLKAVFVSVFSAISTPISVVNSKLLAFQHLLEGDFDKAGAALAEGAVLAAQNWDNATNAFERATKQIEELGRARAKIRGDSTQKDDPRTDDNSGKKQADEETKAVEKLFEVRQDDLDVLNKMINSQTKLQEITSKSFEGEISDFQKVRNNHQARLDMIDEIILAEQNARMERTKELNLALAAGTIGEEEYYERRTEMLKQHLGTVQNANESRFRSEEKLQQDITDLENKVLDEAVENRMAMMRKLFDDIKNITSGTSALLIEIQENLAEHSIRNRDAAIENIKKLEEQGTISAEESAKRRENIEKSYQAQIEKQVMRAFRMKQAAAVSTILIDMAMATARAMKDYTYPVSLGIAALAAGKAGLELAAVKSQPPPKFDVGGMVGQSDPLAPDQTQAQLLTGEAVLDRSTVQRLGGEQGIRDLQNTTRSNNIVVIQPFKHFDRFLSANEKRGRFGSKRASGRY